MQTRDFDYELPAELIAQAPADRRDQSRLLVWERGTGRRSHRRFTDLPEYFRSGDVLVLNNSRVLPARLHARNSATGGSFELTLLEQNGRNDWWVMLRPGKRARINTKIDLMERGGAPSGVHATVSATNPEGHRRLNFSGTADIAGELERLGEMPLPPYIKRESEHPADRERYQTVYASAAGSVAAPTAGLHFTEQLLAHLRARGVEVCELTLHVGLGTFAPVKAERVEAHLMHEECFALGSETADRINRARADHRRVIAVGTTTVRVLESVAERNAGKLLPGTGQTRIFIYPPRNFLVVDALLTNFHLPCSTLLMLVSAFASPGKTVGRELTLETYAEAVRQRYRFFSYGDAMLIL